MRHVLAILAALLALSAGEANADTSNSDREAVAGVVKSLYKTRPESLYFFEFPKTGVDKKRWRQLIEGHFDPGILIWKNGETPIPDIYPRITDPNDLLSENRNSPLPKESLSEYQNTADLAKITANLSDGSVCVYFLRHLAQGWRIYKVRSYASKTKDLYLAGEDTIMREYPDNKIYLNDKTPTRLSDW